MRPQHRTVSCRRGYQSSSFLRLLLDVLSGHEGMYVCKAAILPVGVSGVGYRLAVVMVFCPTVDSYMLLLMVMVGMGGVDRSND